MCKKFINVLHDMQKRKTEQMSGKKFRVLPGFQFTEFVGKVGTIAYYGFPEDVLPILRFEQGWQVAIPEEYLGNPDPWWMVERSLYSWWFWSDPYGQLRVLDPRFGLCYEYMRPDPNHVDTLILDGWDRETTLGIDYYLCRDEEVALATIEKLGLPVPDKKAYNEKDNSRHCHRIYWCDFTYLI